MASVLTRRTLARVALALNARAGAMLPALILMTDAARLADPRKAAAALPKGSAIILRHRDNKERARIARSLRPIVRRRDLILLIADDPALVQAVGADGLHCSEAKAAEAARWRTRRKDWFITVAAHSERSLRRAVEMGAHAALLAPVFATESHRGRAALGNIRFRTISAAAALPVYALGGIDADGARRLAGAKASGLAAIGALIPD